MKYKKNITFGLSQKLDGQMILRLGGDANREKFFSKIGIDIRSVVSADLVHGNKIKVISSLDKSREISNTDGLITSERDVCLTVTVSDCLPIFFFEPKQGIIGLAHAGWRGVLANIAREMIDKMVSEYGIEASSIQVYVGPHIKDCHFEIKNDILDKFSLYPESVIKREGKTFVNLSHIIISQLNSLGLKNNNIEVDLDCTYCSNKYFSFRRDRTDDVVAQIAYIIKK
jgi:YfiH family protein